MPTRFIELAGEINHHMPEYVVNRTAQALNDRGKAVKGSRSPGPGPGLQARHRRRPREPQLRADREARSASARTSTTTTRTSPQTHHMRHHDLNMKSVPLTPESLAELRLRADRDQPLRLRLHSSPTTQTDHRHAQQPARCQRPPRTHRHRMKWHRRPADN